MVPTCFKKRPSFSSPLLNVEHVDVDSVLKTTLVWTSGRVADDEKMLTDGMHFIVWAGRGGDPRYRQSHPIVQDCVKYEDFSHALGLLVDPAKDVDFLTNVHCAVAEQGWRLFPYVLWSPIRLRHLGLTDTSSPPWTPGRNVFSFAVPLQQQRRAGFAPQSASILTSDKHFTELTRALACDQPRNLVIPLLASQIHDARPRRKPGRVCLR